MASDNGNDFTKENEDIQLESYIKMINKLSYNNEVANMETDDLRQELFMRYLVCLKKFDRTKGVKFSTYLYSSLTRHIIRLRKQAKLRWERLDERTSMNHIYNNGEDKDIELGDNIELEIGYDTEILRHAIEILNEREYGYITLELYINKRGKYKVMEMYDITFNKLILENENNLEYIRDELNIIIGEERY